MESCPTYFCLSPNILRIHHPDVRFLFLNRELTHENTILGNLRGCAVRVTAWLFDERSIWPRRSRRWRRNWRRRRRWLVATIWRRRDVTATWRWQCFATFRRCCVASIDRLAAIGRQFALIQSSQRRSFAPVKSCHAPQSGCRERGTTANSTRNPTEHRCRFGIGRWFRHRIPTIDSACDSSRNRRGIRGGHWISTIDFAVHSSWRRIGSWSGDSQSARKHASRPRRWQRGITTSQPRRWNSGSRGKSPADC